MAGIPKIFCIDYSAAPERRPRMERRLFHHGLLERTTFLDAVTVPGPRLATPEWKDSAGRACFASHLKAMRTMLDDRECAKRGVIVCENDVLPHNEFVPRVEAALENLPPGAPHCSLGYLLDRWNSGFTWAGREPERENLCRMVPWSLFGSHIYWISPAYARETLERYDGSEVDELPSITEEIAWGTAGYASYPALGIQDAIDSTIRPPEELDFHIRGQAPWPYTDYSSCEQGEDHSPLASEPSPRRTIGLCMIVRDEAQVIERCLDSVLPLIDSWTICDTGSEDATPELIAARLARVPGQLHHRAWRDFGANRSELMELARGSADYLLLVDADQTLDRRGPLPPLQADAYLLRHEESVSYSVPRLVRGDRRWWFEGSTHEYLATEGEFTQEDLHGVVVRHHGDSGTRGEKLERDIRLLERDLSSDRGSDRATFYLAQTYREAGQSERAIELYRRRVELGGWDEEVFYAAYQAGVLTGHTDPDAAIPLLLDAHELRPSRAEPLWELARLCRLGRRYEAAYLFARRGAELEVPGDLLFVHQDAYEWGLAFELAVAAYWTGRHHEALDLSDRLLDERRMPGEVERAVLQNREYSLAALGPDAPRRPPRVETLSSLLPSLELGELRLQVDPDWPVFNPSIAADGEGFRLVARTANYRLVDGRYEFLDGDGIIRTLNYLVRLDGDLALTDVQPLTDTADGPPRHPSPVEGYEDCRLVRVGGRWYASATVRDRSPDAACEIALLALDGPRIESVRLLTGPEPGRDEKNWMPFVVDGQLRFVYTCAPTVVFTCDPVTGALERFAEHPAPEAMVELRGGSQGVKVGDELLFVVHEAFDSSTGRTYTHRFVLFDENLRLAGASVPFDIAGERIEICAGMAQRGEDLVLSFGVGDRVAGLGICSRDEVLGLIAPVA